MNRRHFLRSTALTAASASLLPLQESSAAILQENPLCVFNKPLQHLSYDDQAAFIKELGVAGIEGTVRKGGHVEPERVEEDLPRQIEALQKRGLEMTVMTTDVFGAENPLSQRVLKTAAALGVKRFRMGAHKYDYARPIPEQIEEIAKEVAALVAYCRELKILPMYQNHSGAERFGAPLWDLYEVIHSYPPEEMAVAFDIRHATVEGGLSWPTEYHLMRPHFGAVYLKDFVWGEKKPENVPLGTGRVDFPRFLKLLNQSGYTGPISLHMEYISHKDPGLLKESMAAIRLDLNTLREWQSNL